MQQPTATAPILVIDDDDAVREVLCMMLELEGHRVAGARNGREGLDLLGTMPRPCLILLDLMMPVMDGRGFLEALHADPALAGIPVVVVTAFPQQDETLLGHRILTKPIELDELTRTVTAACGLPPRP